MPKILESIITTVGESANADVCPHIAPMGVWWEEKELILAPFKPSATLTNIRQSGTAVVNFTDDVQVFAGCLTGRHNWPLSAATLIKGMRLTHSQHHLELELVRETDKDEIRSKCYCRVVHEESHKPFNGFNRAKAAVIECAILVSRLHMLPAEKIHTELKYLQIAIDKTAGPRELEAWNWLMEKVESHFSDSK